MKPYAIISVGGKQYRVSEGERLLVDKVPDEAGKRLTFATLLTGGNGDAELAPKGVTVTARVVDHVLGKKVRIGKYKPKKGYKRHAGHRSRLSRIEIESIGKRGAGKAEKAAEPSAAEKPKAKSRATAKPAAQKQPAAAKKPAARKPAQKEAAEQASKE